MDLWKSLGGMVVIEITSADPAALLTAVHNAGIGIYQTVQEDNLTLRLHIQRNQYRTIKKLCDRRGDRIRLLNRIGIYWTLKGLLKRPVLLSGIAAMFLLVCFLPTRIYFIQVEGNLEIPAQKILEEAENCGICFGASRRQVRSEQMKNALLSAIPELQWAGVNTYGCTAIISVRERTETEKSDDSCGVSRIVASRDGVISSCTVTRGNTLVKVGQAVRAGEVLVSGYTDCGLSIRAERSEAEIYAETERSLTAITPVEYLVRGDIQTKTKKFGLIIGKKRINFYKDSGISGSSCAKMYTEYCVTLPGGFELPIKLFSEEWITYDNSSVTEDLEQAEVLLSFFSEKYLAQQMVAGKILKQFQFVEQVDDIYQLTGEYACLEMIGQERSEEIIDK